jgi:hypothetical protein
MKKTATHCYRRKYHRSAVNLTLYAGGFSWMILFLVSTMAWEAVRRGTGRKLDEGETRTRYRKMRR